jgi:uncharacterized protein (TIGR02117 family)
VLVALAGLLWACAGPVAGLYPPAGGEPTRSVFVVDHGWHTGIVVRREHLPDSVGAERNDLADSEYVEVGWGDADFYRAEQPTSSLGLKAAVWSTSSVLYVVGLDQPPYRSLDPAHCTEVRLSARGLSELDTFIAMTFARDERGEVIELGPGPAPNSRFYLAKGTYSLLNTCNTWVARALRAGGCPITPLYAVTAGNVMFQAGRCDGTAR